MKRIVINLAVSFFISFGGSQLAAAATKATKAMTSSNPFEGAVSYVNPDYAKDVEKFFKENPDYAAKAGPKPKGLGLVDKDGKWQIPTAIWLDSTRAINGEPGRSHAIEWYLENALDKFNKNETHGKPIVLTVVIYNLPMRDCDAYSSNGEYKLADLPKYKADYIDVIKSRFSKFYGNKIHTDKVRLVLIIEPDSLPNMLTNVRKDHPTQACLDADKENIYSKGIAYALNQFSDIPAISMYLDIAHSGWLGWDSNANQIPAIYNNSEEVVYYGKDKNGKDIRHLGLGKGFDHVRGFITNTANYTPLKENFDYREYIGGNNNIRNTDFYEWNMVFDENSYIAEIMSLDDKNATGPNVFPKFYAQLNKNGDNVDLTIKPEKPHYAGKHFLIDTSRNGWIVNKSDYKGTRGNGAAYSRRDQRHHRGNWCNAQSVQSQNGYAYDNPSKATIPSKPTSSGFGEFPRVPNANDEYDRNLIKNPLYATDQLLPIDAFVWIKPPGEGDGSYTPKPNEAGDQMCGSLPYIAKGNNESGGGSHNDFQPTDSLQDNGKPAPHAGKFFPAAIKNMIDASICIQGIRGFTSPFCSM